MPEVRLQKFIANSGLCSRRKAEILIQEGKVRVNESIVTELGVKINPELDDVYVNDKIVKLNNTHMYILLNKPIGYVTTKKDQFDRPIVTDLINDCGTSLLPVGRLDMYTSGALILTNDGDFIYNVTHPKNEIEKTYNATVRGVVDEFDVQNLERGVKIEDYVSGRAKVKILRVDREKNISRIEITIHEGKNREVRKMCAAIGKKVIALHRAKIGDISVKNMRIGEWRYLTENEISQLKK